MMDQGHRRGSFQLVHWCAAAGESHVNLVGAEDPLQLMGRVALPQTHRQIRGNFGLDFIDGFDSRVLIHHNMIPSD
jgi:hypothetical protein